MKSCSILIVSCFCVVMFLATCKKETKTTPPVSYDVVGTWVVTAFKSTYGDTVNVTSVQYPCLAQNNKTFLANGIMTTGYSGDSICYITPHVNLSAPYVVVGKPGETSDTATWKVNGNILAIKSSNTTLPTEYGTLSMVNGKLQLILRDTLNYSGGPYYASDVEVKQ